MIEVGACTRLINGGKPHSFSLPINRLHSTSSPPWTTPLMVCFNNEVKKTTREREREREREAVMDTRATTCSHEKGDDGDKHERHPPSNARCCCLLVVFLLFLLVLLCAVLVILLKPEKPFFSLHSIQIDPFNLNASSSKEVYIPPSTATLSFLTGNPNKYGIVYTSSALGVLSDGIAVGVIRVPMFYQPPRSQNVSVQVRFSFGRLDLMQLTHGGLLNSSYAGPRVVAASIAGRVRAQVHVLNFSLPKIKVAVNCRVTVDYGSITFSKAISFLRTRKALLLSSFPQLSQKCSLGLHL